MSIKSAIYTQSITKRRFNPSNTAIIVQIPVNYLVVAGGGGGAPWVGGGGGGGG